VVPDAETVFVGRARHCPVTITPYLEEDWSLYDNDNDSLTTDNDSSSESDERAVAFLVQDGDVLLDVNLFEAGEDDDLAEILNEGSDEGEDEEVAAGSGNMEGDEGNGECKASLEKAEKVGAQPKRV